MSGARGRPRNPDPRPDTSGFDEWPEEDVRWLLAEMERAGKRGGGKIRKAELEKWAEDRTWSLIDVEKQAQLLQWSARDVAARKGVDCPVWARKDALILDDDDDDDDDDSDIFE
jgi:hypothetical protein